MELPEKLKEMKSSLPESNHSDKVDSGMVINISDFRICDKKLKFYNKTLNDLLHILEDVPLDAPALVKVAIKIKTVRIQRRKWKNLSFIKDAMGQHTIDKLCVISEKQHVFNINNNTLAAEHFKHIDNIKI